MAHRDEELKAQMMAQAEAAIEALLAERAKKGELDLSDIEQLARGAGQRVMQELTVDLAEAEAAKEEDTKCPECGQWYSHKMARPRPDARYKELRMYCKQCKRFADPEIDRINAIA